MADSHIIGPQTVIDIYATSHFASAENGTWGHGHSLASCANSSLLNMQGQKDLCCILRM